MNLSEYKSIESILSKLSDGFIDEKVKVFYEGKSLEKERIEEYTVIEYIVAVKKLLKKFSVAFKEDYIHFPIFVSINSSFSNNGINLQQELNQINNLFSNLNLPPNSQIQNLKNSAGMALRKLGLYQRLLGIWDNGSQPAKIETSNEKLEDTNERLNLLSISLNASKKDIIKLTRELSGEKEELKTFIQAKQKELDTISQNLQVSNTQRTQINNHLNDATKTLAEIEGFKKNGEKLVTELDVILDNKKSELPKFKESLDSEKGAILNPVRDEIKKISEDKNEITKYLDILNKENIEERIKQLNQLIQLKGASNLFETFNQRKAELNQPVLIWGIVTIIVFIAVFLLGILVFSNFNLQEFGKTPDSISIQILIINTIKMIPAIIILLFSSRQYAKERAFQEEYAFRSAVALTVQAYADLIKGEKGQEIKNRLIADAVKDVYRSPKPMSWEGGNVISFRTKGLNDSIKSLTDMIKELKDGFPGK